MVKAQRVRWTLLLSALAATIVAVTYPEPQEPAAIRHERAGRTHGTPAVPKTAGAEPASGERQPDWLAATENPFTPRAWQAPALSPVEPARSVAAEVAPPSSPPPLPPLPFKFIGQMVDGSDQVIYLEAGDQVLLARAGSVLDGGYKVVTITPGQIEFELTANGVRQTLPLPAKEL